MPALTLAMAKLAGTVVHSTMYGIYLLLFIGSIYALWFKHRTSSGKHYSRSINKIVLSAVIILFVLISAQWIIQIARLFDTFIFVANGTTPAQVYGAFGNPKNVAEMTLFIVQTLVSDIIMICRLFVVWDRSWIVVIVPALIELVVLFVAGISIIVSFVRSGRTQGAESFRSTSSTHWITIATVLSITMNFMVAALIAYKIWSIHRRVQTLIPSRMMTIVKIIIESAGIYISFEFMGLVGFLVNSPFQFIVSDAISPTIGIAFSLIIVRVALGLGDENNETTMSSRSNPELVFRSENQILNSVPIRVSKEVDVSRPVGDSDGNIVEDEDSTRDAKLLSLPRAD